jgi:phosphate transport system permease protein
MKGFPLCLSVSVVKIFFKDMTNEQKRKLEGYAALVLSSLAALFGLFWLVFILGDVIVHGIGAINLGLFLNDPAPAGVEGGGLRHAFVGQLMITFFATLIGVPIGILGGTFLAEYAKRTRYARVISVLADIIVSVPSIVVGTFIYALLVRPLGHFSGWAGAVALSVIMIPVVLRTTEDMLSMVPWTLREAAFALGAPYYKVIVQVVYRGAATGILTGVLLSIARVAGETAPLLFTSFNNNFFSWDMNRPIASLTMTIFQYAMGPYDDWHRQAWAAAFVITLFILALTLLGRLVLRWRYKQ